MNTIARTLGDFLAAVPRATPLALVGGIAVSARCEPRFTRDLDFAVAVADDAEAEAYVHGLGAHGYLPVVVLQHTALGRLSTVRLRRGGRGPLLDLLFASSGIEPEITADAEDLEIGQGISTRVARVGHLIALKLLSRNDATRPQDGIDLRALAAVATTVEWDRATRAVELIASRGFARGRQLLPALHDLRTSAG